MSISSLDDSPASADGGKVLDIGHEAAASGIARSASSAQSRPSAPAGSHNRSSSLGTIGSGRTQPRDQRTSEGQATSGSASPPSESISTPQPAVDPASSQSLKDKPLPEMPATGRAPSQTRHSPAQPKPASLRPFVVSPSPEEFLLVTGTSLTERGIGMFVNLEGDPPTRPTLEFERYPEDLAVDGASPHLSSSEQGSLDSEIGYVLASMARDLDDGLHYGLEIQQWDTSGEEEPTKYWLEAENAGNSEVYGVRCLTGRVETRLDEIVEKLSDRRFSPFPGSTEGSGYSLRSVDSRTALSMERLSKERELFDRDLDSQEEDSLPDGWEAARISEGEAFARQFSMTQGRLAVWAGRTIWLAVRNPSIIRLDAGLETACATGKVNIRDTFAIVAPLRGRHDESNVLEFLTFGFIRQKAGLLLLISFCMSSEEGDFSDSELSALEEVLVESKLDPRVALSLIPGVRNEIIEGRQGIWVYGEVKRAAEAFLLSQDFDKQGQREASQLDVRTLHFFSRYLWSWRKMKGFGSVRDEKEVFRSVDAALLLVLLELDRRSMASTGKGGGVRAELYELVDKGVDCFDRAVDLLTSYHRLFVLSRLYQSRKMASDVLATWKLIIEGERDDGHEFHDGEERVRQYLAKISSQSLVQEYGVWLAIRNPRLGVQVFAEDRGRAPKFEPAKAVEILRAEAPEAVKYYLEHLVFVKGNAVYVNDLITYYLDVVLGDLQTSAIESRERLIVSYDTYRALQAPKPTYSHFLTDNTPADDEVRQSRLRLLQLLGGNQRYDTASIRQRIGSASAGDLLVPETIILCGRERQHEEALRLLVHKLGDFDTAISYCLRGGSSIYTPRVGHRDSLPSADQQRQLFHAVLREFLAIEDISDRVDQTGALLERFGRWFDVDQVLCLVPDDWSVDILGGFLVGALRRLVAERHQSMVARALSGAENLRVSHDVIVKIDEKGPRIEAST